jgi:hypothetical protein
MVKGGTTIKKLFYQMVKRLFHKQNVLMDATKKEPKANNEQQLFEMMQRQVFQ